MSANTSDLAKALARVYGSRAVDRLVSTPVASSDDMAKYHDDPVGFIRDAFGIDLTMPQLNAALAMPGRIKINSGHGLGKTLLCAALAIWWYATRNPGVVIITAPTSHHITTVLFAEIRLLLAKCRIKLPGTLSPKAPLLYDSPEHWIEGFTSSSGEGFQGRHRASMFFIFDECEDVDAVYWQTTETMYKDGEDHAWLTVGNPLTTSSQSYLEDLAEREDGTPKWKQYVLSSMDHPNIIAQLNGEPPPIPNAVTLHQVNQWVKDWTDPVQFGDIKPLDFEWPVGSQKWRRPSPIFKGRVLGIRPTEGVDTVWGAVVWQMATTRTANPSACWWGEYGITIGVDVAMFGDDSTAIHLRSGPMSLLHEEHNGWTPQQTAGRLKDLCVEYADVYNSWAVIPTRPRLEPSDVSVVIEVDGYGYSVLSHCDGFGNWSGFKAGEASTALDHKGQPRYTKRRSEMWFTGKEKAMGGQMDLSYLPQDVLQKLRLELMSSMYWATSSGAIQVEEKVDIKKRLKKSPDGADALLVCYADVTSDLPMAIIRGE